MRSVRDISRDDRARIATYSLRTPTDRLMDNYSIEYSVDVTIVCTVHIDMFQIIGLVLTAIELLSD